MDGADHQKKMGRESSSLFDLGDDNSAAAIRSIDNNDKDELELNNYEPAAPCLPMKSDEKNRPQREHPLQQRPCTPAMMMETSTAVENEEVVAPNTKQYSSPPLPMAFVEFVTISQDDDQQDDVNHASSMLSPRLEPQQRLYRSSPHATSSIPDAASSLRPFRLLPRSRTTLDRVVMSGSVGSSPSRPRKRSAWSMSDCTTEEATLATTNDTPASPSTTLKNTLNRLSIHSPSCSSEATYEAAVFQQRSSTPSSFANKRSSTPLTIEGSPSSCFSRVISTPRPLHRTNSLGVSPRESPSPKIVPLTVLSHDDSASGEGGTKLPPMARHRHRIFPPRSPPEVRNIWCNHDEMSFQETPDSASTAARIPKISLTPRGMAKRSPTIPKFPSQEEEEDSKMASAGPVTVASFLSLPSPPRISQSILGPPPTMPIDHSRPDSESLTDGEDEFLLAFPSTLAEEKQRRSVKLRKTDEHLLGDKTRSMASMASSSCTSLRGIAFAPSDLSLCELMAHHGGHNMTTMDGQTDATMDGPNGGGMMDGQNVGGTMEEEEEQQQQDAAHHHVGWVFDDADEQQHIPISRDSMVTPPLLSLSSSSSNNHHLPPLLPAPRGHTRNHHLSFWSQRHSPQGSPPAPA